MDARAQHGHTMFVRTSTQSAEALRGSGVCSPRKFLEISQPPSLVLKPYHSEVYITYTANSCMVSIRDS